MTSSYKWLVSLYDGVLGVPSGIFLRILVLTVILKVFAVGLGYWFVLSPPDYLSHHENAFDMLSIAASYEEQLIAKHGYLLDLPQKRLIAKPPLYALITRMVMLGSDIDASIAIFVVHSISVLFSLVWVYRFAVLLFNEHLAFYVMLLFPFSLAGTGHIYLLSFHEPLTITLVMAIFYHLHQRNDVWVAILTAFFALSRSQVFVLILLFALVVLRDGRMLWQASNARETERFLIVNAILNRIFKLCMLPTIAFLMWQVTASLYTGWQFAPMYAQRFYAHGFGWHKPYELVRSFIILLHPNLSSEQIPFHLIRCVTIIVVLLSLLYLLRESRNNSYLLPATGYAVSMLLIMAFVGLNDMPRLLHATIMPFAVPMMMYKVGHRFGRLHRSIWSVTYIVLSIMMMGFVLHNYYVESLGIII